MSDIDSGGEERPSRAATEACASEEALILRAAGAIEDADLTLHVAACPICRARVKRLADDDAFLAGVVRISALGGPESARDSASREPSLLHSAPVGYRLLAEISRGGQGVVHTAIEESSGRVVAIKTLLGGHLASSRAQARFEREIEIAASLSHPAIVRVYAVSRSAHGDMAIVMEYVKGEDLSAWASRQRATLSAAAWATLATRVIAQVAAATGFAHRRGIIHRDLKPSNIMVDETGGARVLDFGVARRVESGASTCGGGVGLTFTGEFSGTLAYAAPEQVTCEGDGVDTRTDVYAMGLILYELLAGRPAYDVGSSLSEAVAAISVDEPAPLRARGRTAVSTDVETVVFKALAKDPQRRYATADAMAADLDAALKGLPIEARRDSVMYVLRKRLVRHWQLAATAAGLVLLITMFTMSEAREAAMLRAQAIERQRANAEAVRSRAVAFVMSTLLPCPTRFDVGVGDVRAHAVARELLLLEGQIEQGMFADEPEYEQALRTTIATLYRESAGLSGRGELVARQVLSGSMELNGPQHASTAAARHELAEVLLNRKRPEEAEIESVRAADQRARLLGTTDNRTIESRVLAAKSQLAQGNAFGALATLDNLAAQLELIPKTLAVELLVTRAVALAELGRPTEAGEAATDALERAAAHLTVRDRAFAAALRTAGALAPTSDFPIDLIELAEAIEDSSADALKQLAALTGAIAVREAVVGPTHKAVGFDLATVAWISILEGHFGSAAIAMEKAVPILDASIGPMHPAMASMYDRLGFARTHVENFSGAADAFARSIEIWLAQPPGVQDRVSIAVQHRYMAQALILACRFDEAEAAAREAVKRLTEEFTDEHYAVGMAMCTLAWANAERGAGREGTRLVRAGRALMAASPATPPDQILNADAMLGLVLWRDGQAAASLPILKKSVELLCNGSVHDVSIQPFVKALAESAAAAGEPVPTVVARYRAAMEATDE